MIPSYIFTSDELGPSRANLPDRTVFGGCKGRGGLVYLPNRNNSPGPAGDAPPKGAALHEMSIAQSILNLVREEAGSAGLARVEEVRLRIGGMSGVVPDSLSFCWALMTEGEEAGPAQGAALSYELIPVSAHCQECGEDFQVENYAFACPSCGSAKVTVTDGRELTLSSIVGE
jgi:hydrogenase nickel incorporation protein HypA/HybF